MQLVRSFCEADFKLYVQCFGQLVPWMFALDHINYARGLPVHIRDMVQLQRKHPLIRKGFISGNFVVQRSAHVFFTTAIDQAHEQMNAKVKGHGGVIGLIDNESASLRWIIAGPEVTRIVKECRVQLNAVWPHKRSSDISTPNGKMPEWLICLVYLDGIIVFGESFEEMLERLEAVLQCLSKYGSKLKPSKCKLFWTKLTYLGHIVSRDGVGPDLDKIAIIIIIIMIIIFIS